MTETPLQELLQALGEGLARPAHFWSAIAIGCALVGGWFASRVVRHRVEARLAQRIAAGGTQADALRFSIEGFRRLAFPITAQLLLWVGEGVLRVTGRLPHAADAQLLRLAMTLLGAMALARLLVYVLRRVFARAAFIGVFERSIAAVVWIVVALHLVGVLDDVVQWLDSHRIPLGRTPVSLWTLVTATISVLVTLLVALWIGSALEARLLRAETVDMNVRVVAARLVRALLLTLGVLLALSLTGIDLTVLSVFGGALGVGLGLGLQRIASNYVSGFIILLDRSLRIGDLITVDKYYGVVSQIKTRYTVVRALDGTEAIVPNEMLVSSPVTNHSYTDRRVRLAVKVSVAYEADLDRALALMEEAARSTARVLADPVPAAVLLGFGADGLDLEVGFWIADPEQGRLNVQSLVAQSILARFRAAAISIPFPQREVHLTGWNPGTRTSG
jgi:small-conductance mechanosensitive channel